MGLRCFGGEDVHHCYLQCRHYYAHSCLHRKSLTFFVKVCGFSRSFPPRLFSPARLPCSNSSQCFCVVRADLCVVLPPRTPVFRPVLWGLLTSSSPSLLLSPLTFCFFCLLLPYCWCILQTCRVVGERTGDLTCGCLGTFRVPPCLPPPSLTPSPAEYLTLRLFVMVLRLRLVVQFLQRGTSSPLFCVRVCLFRLLCPFSSFSRLSLCKLVYVLQIRHPCSGEFGCGGRRFVF